MTFSAYISNQPADSMQCETISLTKFQPSHGAVDFLGNLGAFHWENPNPYSCFCFKAANSFFETIKAHFIEEKLADLAPCNL